MARAFRAAAQPDTAICAEISAPADPAAAARPPALHRA